MVLSLLAIKVNQCIEKPVLCLDGTSDRERLSIRFSTQHDGVAFLKDFRPEVIRKSQRGSKHTHDRRLPTAIRSEEHRGSVPKLEKRAFPSSFAQRLDL